MISTNGVCVQGLKSRKTIAEELIKANGLNVNFFTRCKKIEEAKAISPFKPNRPKDDFASVVESMEYTPNFFESRRS